MSPESARLDEADRALLERLAARLVDLRLEVPAVLALEAAMPLSLVAAQAMVFFEPVVAAMFRLPEYRRLRTLLGRRTALAALVRAIEARAAALATRRRAPWWRRSGLVALLFALLPAASPAAADTARAPAPDSVGAPAPASGLEVTDVPHDAGRALALTWRASPEDPRQPGG